VQQEREQLSPDFLLILTYVLLSHNKGHCQSLVGPNRTPRRAYNWCNSSQDFSRSAVSSKFSVILWIPAF
jgi:hypothetical protein